MTIMNVRKIGFFGQTDDDRSPENFAFPAAMTSIMEYLGENVHIETIYAHNRSYTDRGANLEFIAASGIGFALLWEDALCMSAADLLQASPYEQGIRNAFAWSGWKYNRVSGEAMKQAAVKAVQARHPFIALGLTDVPEAALVCGCDETGDTLYGWSHFQGGMETIENGMFKKTGWTEHTWELIIPTERVGRSLSICDLIREGVRIMAQDAVEGYRAGDAAYDAWICTMEGSCGANRALYDYHKGILLNLAEARCRCGDFLLRNGIEAGKHFQAIHDLCWKADEAVHGAEEMADPEKRAALIEVLRTIRAEDLAALAELKALAAVA